jgi:hypothetical protein
MGVSLVDIRGEAAAYSDNRDLIPKLSQAASTLVNARLHCLQETMDGAEGA